MGLLIHQADCREWLTTLADKSVAHCITDPPYEASAHTKQRRVRSSTDGSAWQRGARGSKVEVAPIDFDPIDEETRMVVAREIARVVRGWILIFCQVEGVSAWCAALEVGGARYVRTQVWVKPDSCPQFTGDRPGAGYESIVTAWAGDGRMTWNGGGRRGVYFHHVGVNGGERNEHPTQKPLPLMLELVELFTSTGDLVLDPFAGSGTTGVACLRLGREFIGCEREKRYFDLASERLRAESEGTTVQAARAGQTSLFGRAG